MAVGAPVQARYKCGDKWYTGKVEKVNADGTFDIRYDDGDGDEGLEREFVKTMAQLLAEQEAEEEEKVAAAAAAAAEAAVTVAAAEAAAAAAAAAASGGKGGKGGKGGGKQRRTLEVGASVKARHGGKWCPGRVETANADGSYGIRYDDGEAGEAVKEQVG
jgi:hypothetical protein